MEQKKEHTENRRDRGETKKDRFEERVIKLSRVSKTVKGGRRMSFSALVVVGDKNGFVGYGLGKANEVAEAVRKAAFQARKTLVHVPMEKNTIPYRVETKFGASKIFLSPAPEGRGVVAGSAVRTVAELAGISNLTSKIRGSRNPHTVVRATFLAFKNMLLRSDYMALRGSLDKSVGSES